MVRFCALDFSRVDKAHKSKRGQLIVSGAFHADNVSVRLILAGNENEHLHSLLRVFCAKSIIHHSGRLRCMWRFVMTTHLSMLSLPLCILKWLTSGHRHDNDDDDDIFRLLGFGSAISHIAHRVAALEMITRYVMHGRKGCILGNINCIHRIVSKLSLP